MSVPSIASIVRYGLRGRPAFNGSVLGGLANGRGLGCAHGRILNGAGRRWSGRHSSSWWRDGGVWHAAYAVGVGRVSGNSRVRVRLPNIGGLVGLVLYDLDGVLDNVLSGGHRDATRLAAVLLDGVRAHVVVVVVHGGRQPAYGLTSSSRFVTSRSHAYKSIADPGFAK